MTNILAKKIYDSNERDPATDRNCNEPVQNEEKNKPFFTALLTSYIASLSSLSKGPHVDWSRKV
ncbi:hypothetical protein [Paremcibacter congregatus]|uniref:hypothetical protein n=1 Tax=Paremcibacter congregatus TaxID=2043170 RepID=UPI003A92EDE8